MRLKWLKKEKKSFMEEITSGIVSKKKDIIRYV